MNVFATFKRSRNLGHRSSFYPASIALFCVTASLMLTGCGNDDDDHEETLAEEVASAKVIADSGSAAPAEKVFNSESSAAMHALLETVDQVQAKYLSANNKVETADDIAEGQRAIAHILHTALYFWLEADSDRPEFKPYVSSTRKLLGDNPDSIYYFAPIRDDRSYRITGNVGAATFTSFTIEGGSGEGHAARSSIGAISDNEMQIAPDGSYEIIVSREKPAKGNWLPLKEGAGQITTRHYHQSRQSVAANPHFQMDIHIEALDPSPLGDYGGDSQVANRLEWVTNYVREHAAMMLTSPSKEIVGHLGWYSFVPNEFGTPGQWESASGDMAYGNTHAYYNAGNYELAEDEALVIEGELPHGRFFNVVLWNRFMQSYDYGKRQVSLNGEQIHLYEGRKFRIIVAHQDPGLPNWLDTEGRLKGHLYWRYIFPNEQPTAPTTKVVKLDALK